MSELQALRDLPPVEPVELPGRYSRGLLERFDVCPRSAYLYRKHSGGPATHPMNLGSLLHLSVAEAVREMDRQDAQTIDPDTAKAIADGQLTDHPEYPIPVHLQDDLRQMMWHFAQVPGWHDGFRLEGQVAAVEAKFDLDLGLPLTGILDLAVVNGTTATLYDWKSVFHLPSQDEFEASFQLVFYALLLAFGAPDSADPVGRGVQQFRLTEVYPRHLRDDGHLQERSRVVDRAELHELLSDTARLCARVKQAFADWRFPAVPGSHCNTCPSRPDCPLPARLRDWHGSLDDTDGAQVAGERWLFLDREARALKRELREWAKQHGPVRVGRDLVLDFRQENRRETDWEGLELALEEGLPINPGDFIAVKSSSRFDKRKLTRDEIQDLEEAVA